MNPIEDDKNLGTIDQSVTGERPAAEKLVTRRRVGQSLGLDVEPPEDSTGDVFPRDPTHTPK